jgi:hypothetical protein
MYESLIKNEPDSHVYIFAFDDITFDILKKSDLQKTTIISLKEFENEDLLNVKSTRTRAEYCWTCTSSVVKYVLDRFSVPSCTYIDADLFFYSSPEVLINEMSDEKSVLITEHRYSRFAQLREQKRAGRFCVQFITFKNTSESNIILNKWISQCIDWCYARYEEGKFGDQKYLENWPDEYSTVHVLDHLGGGVAPWNVRQYDFTFVGDKIFGLDQKTKTKFEVVFFHFHFVRFMLNGYADIGWNWLPGKVVSGFYKPYLQLLIEKEKFLRNSYPHYKSIFVITEVQGMRENIKHILKGVSGYNLIKIPVI